MRLTTAPIPVKYSLDWLTMSAGVNVGFCLTDRSTALPAGVPGAGGASGAGPCAKTVLPMKIVVSKSFVFTTAPVLSP